MMITINVLYNESTSERYLFTVRVMDKSIINKKYTKLN